MNLPLYLNKRSPFSSYQSYISDAILARCNIILERLGPLTGNEDVVFRFHIFLIKNMNGELISIMNLDLDQLKNEPPIFWSSFVESVKSIFMKTKNERVKILGIGSETVLKYQILFECSAFMPNSKVEVRLRKMNKKHRDREFTLYVMVSPTIWIKLKDVAICLFKEIIHHSGKTKIIGFNHFSHHGQYRGKFFYEKEKTVAITKKRKLNE